MFGLVNVASIVLGLIAWILPVANLMKYNKHDHKNCVFLSVISISACAASLFFR